MKSKGHKMSRCLTNGWWNRLIKQWPELSLQKGDCFAVVHENASSCEVFESYFNLLDDVLTKNMLKDKPGKTYNCEMLIQHKD